MAISKISKSSVVTQAKKPSSPTEGLIWYDSSADVLKQYKNGSFQSVSSSPDGELIVKDNNGELTLAPNEILYGDFETGLGQWSANFDNPYGNANVGISSAKSTKGNSSVKVETGFNDSSLDAEINRYSLSYADGDTLTMDVYLENCRFSNSGDAYVTVSASDEYRIYLSSSDEDQWVTLEFNFTGSGSFDIEVHLDAPSVNDQTILYLDNVVHTKNQSTFKVDGAGA